MSDIARLCLMCAVSSVCVTLTICAVICILTLIDDLWKLFRKLCRWTARQIRDEIRQVERQEADEEHQRIRITRISEGELKHGK